MWERLQARSPVGNISRLKALLREVNLRLEVRAGIGVRQRLLH